MAPRGGLVLRPPQRHGKVLLERCSVFGGRLDLQSAGAVAGFDEVDDLAVVSRLLRDFIEKTSRA